MKRAGYVSVPEAAAMSGLTERTIWRQIKDKTLPYDQATHEATGRVWIAREDVPARKVDPLDELRAELEEVKRRLADLEKRPRWPLGSFNGQSDAVPASDVQPLALPAPRPLVAPLSASRHDTSGNGEIRHRGEGISVQDLARMFARHGVNASTSTGWATKPTPIGLLPRGDYVEAFRWAHRYITEVPRVSTRMRRCDDPDGCEARCSEVLP